MGAMTRSQFLEKLKQKPGFKTKTVDVPQFGEVTLRQLDPAQAMELRALKAETDDQKAAIGLASLAISIIDPETNEPMFDSSEESRKLLMQFSIDQTKALLVVFSELNNINTEAIVKNSEPSQNFVLATA